MRQTAPLSGAERVGSLLLGLGVYSLLGKATSNGKPYSYEIETSSKPRSAVFQNGVPASAEQRSGDLNGVGLVLQQVVVSSWTLNEVRAGGGEAVLPETHGRKAAG